MKRLIANNTVLSNFAAVKRLDILRNLYKKIHITPEIYDEIIEGINCGYLFQKLTKKEVDSEEWLLVTELDDYEQKIFIQLSSKLDIGEASCIAIAKHRKMTFFTDDRYARKISDSLNVEYMGTIGILKVALENALISKDEGNDLLKTMIDNGYYSPISKFDDRF